VKIYTAEGSDKILGATIVGQHAGDMISEVTCVMQGASGLSSVSRVIHPYPTQAEAIRKCGDMFNRTRLTPTVKALFDQLMKARRSQFGKFF